MSNESRQVYSAGVLMEDDGIFGTVDVVEHEGRLWIVPWWDDRDEWRSARRLVCMSTLQYQRMSGKAGEPDFLVNEPLPNALFGPDPIPPSLLGRFEVVESPGISVRPLS